ncbi:MULTISPECIES: hypothetical protein [unclassified Nocardiopsis]|uniref:hypothetical protein n=1 Tax=unclassified Nocardiopsis TaxID=2649073 RepID=UPI001915B163|nr:MULTISPECIES: hypothetical protein [unclassified Nocardiopsis]
MDETNKSLDDLVRDELGGEPSQAAKDYARELYERFRLPAPAESAADQAPPVTAEE